LRTAVSLIIAFTHMAAGCEEKKTEGIIPEDDIVTSHDEGALPYLGESDVEFTREKNGTSVVDTVYYTIPKFSFTNQDNKIVSHHEYENKIFVADFFFTTCPSICPILSSQMARLQTLTKKEGLDHDVMFLSHTVDPEHDTPAVLKAYGDQLGADYSNWNFVTGRAEDIYDQAQDGYMLTAFPSDTAQGGFFHTDQVALIDRQMHIRGYYDGTSTKEIDQLFLDIKKLLHEQPAAAANEPR
jgi:protein SCO1